MFQDYGRRNPNQDQQLHTLAVNHGKEMEHLHLRNRDLERKRDGECLASSLLNYYLGLVATKPVFGVSDKVRFKPACSATETS